MRANAIVAHTHQDGSEIRTDAPRRGVAVRMINAGAQALKNQKDTSGTKRVERVGEA